MQFKTPAKYFSQNSSKTHRSKHVQNYGLKVQGAEKVLGPKLNLNLFDL